MNSFWSISLVAAALAWPASFAADDSKTLALGMSAPDFTLPGIDGRTYRLQDFSDAKVLIVLFTCNHCPTAQYYEERIKRIVADYSPKGVALVAISPNDPKSVRLDELGYTDLSDSFDEMKIRAAAKQFNFPYLYDGDTQAVSRAYGPVATPHAFVFDSERRLRYAGRIDDSERVEFVKKHDLRMALDALLERRELPVSQTRTFGCSIKWAGKEEAVRQFMEKLASEPVTVEKADAAALAALRKNDSGKLRLVNVWATWCGACVIEFPELITIHRMYRHRAFEVVTVAANVPDEEGDVLRFLRKQQASGRNLLFGSADRDPLLEALNPKWSGGMPYTMLIAPGGEILYETDEPFDGLELKRRIVGALKEDRFK